MDPTTVLSQRATHRPQSEDKFRSYVVFRIDRQHYALPLDHVIRAVRMVAITPVPDVPNSVLGVINMSGQIVPVIELRGLFGQAGKDPELQDVLLIVRTKNQTVAIVVDEALTILKFAPEQVQPPPTAVSQSPFVAAAVQHDSMLILLVDELRLFPNNNGKMVDGLPWPEIPALNGGKDANGDPTPDKKHEGKAQPVLKGLTRR